MQEATKVEENMQQTKEQQEKTAQYLERLYDIYED